MIIAFADLAQHRGRVAMVDGAFDPLHGGHIAYFRAARALGLPVLCNVASDAYVARKHPVLLPAAERAQIIDALRDVDLTHVNAHDTETVLSELRPRYYVKGADWKTKLPAAQEAICAQHGIEIIYLDTVTNSSTRILETWSAWTRFSAIT